jgi:hypothetical protein
MSDKNALTDIGASDLARRRYWNPVAFRHDVAVSELPLRASRKARSGLTTHRPVASTVTRWCQQACPSEPSRPGHGGLLGVPTNASRLSRAALAVVR